jgi:UDP-glucuronate 4-epimerase
VIASSSSVYGTIGAGETPRPFSEEQSVERPISPYAATKRACELIGFTHHHLTKQPVAMLRFFTVFGPRQRPDLAIRLFLTKIAKGEPIRLFGEGSTSRDYTFIEDIVGGVLAAYEKIPAHGYRVWNLGNSHPVTLDEMVETIAKVVGKPVNATRAAAQAGDVRATWADPERAAAELGFRAKTGFEDGVREQWEWLRTRV